MLERAGTLVDAEAGPSAEFKFWNDQRNRVLPLCSPVRRTGGSNVQAAKHYQTHRVRTASAPCVATVMGLAITASPVAGSQTQDASTQSYALANPDLVRVPVRGNGCSALGWPNFQLKCRSGLTEPAGDAPSIRMTVVQ